MEKNGNRRTAPVLWMDSVDSTNTRLKELAREGAAHGTALIARRQTGGRGRSGRSFESPPGGLYLSLLLCPDCPPERTVSLTAVSALAVRRAVGRACGRFPDIKWPNDLLLDGRKICGILTEQSFTGKALQVVIGVGINVNTGLEDFSPELRRKLGSLLSQTGRRMEIDVLAGLVLEELDGIYAVWLQDGGRLLEEYREACVTRNREVIILQNGKMRRAKALEINDDFSLSVLTEAGEERVSFGEVSVRGLGGE